MPLYKRHLVAGLFSFFFLFVVFRAAELALSPLVWFFSLLACLFGSLFPDVDSKSSKIHRIIADLIVVAIAVIIIAYTFDDFFTMLWLLLIWFLVSISVLKTPLKHRGAVHTIWTATVFGLIVGAISQVSIGSFVPGFFAFLGYFSHLILDRKI